jgi:hypothetical protein
MYEFAGFLASSIPRPVHLSDNAVWRDIDAPFVGVGIRLPELLENAPTRIEIEAIARRLGISEADRWLYLTYMCWGGELEFVYGLGVPTAYRSDRYERTTPTL